jgi:hypothetical protein
LHGTIRSARKNGHQLKGNESWLRTPERRDKRGKKMVKWKLNP